MSEKDTNEKPSKHRFVEVKDELHLEDSVSVTKNSVLEGYNRLSDTFSPQQANLANSIKFEETLKKFTDLMEEQNKNFKEDAKRQTKISYISIAIAIIAIIVTIIIAMFK